MQRSQNAGKTWIIIDCFDDCSGLNCWSLVACVSAPNHILDVLDTLIKSNQALFRDNGG